MRFPTAAGLTALAAVLALAVAPATATTASPAPRPSATPTAYDGTAYHLYVPNRPAIAPGARPPAATMLYFGGPVIAQVKVAVVLWGTTVAKTTTSRIAPFFSAISNSTFVDQLGQYSTVGITGVNGDPGTNQTIVRGTLEGQYVIRPRDTATTLTDRDVQRELQRQITAGRLPKADLNTLYMIYFPSNITITLGKSQSCVAFGAYHEAVSSTVTPSNIFYGVMPDCGGGFSSITVASSHEFAEAITDAIPTPGSHPAYPQAWNTSDGYEIADLCEGHYTTLTAAGEVYSIQEVFTNSTNACATGKFTSP